ncbi:putative membrane protein [Okibacterium sp. HSC-33S16]|uniref:PH domain-containing protein n=1 Tax=Okibacterium sp. HSC-33S16 TaxID=2910965 RepID=UPI0020A19066|nr:PH domain-containing protein [Okibacterium sp. HSC-33S16]MCP2031583.1 putative membrane protein [Okibacterium sp. HSC-33S16]
MTDDRPAGIPPNVPGYGAEQSYPPLHQATDAAGQPPQSPPDERSSRRTLTDGEWHRLHPATPLLRGGIAMLAIVGFLIANLRERLVEIFLPGAGEFDSQEYDPLTYVWEHGFVGLALLGLLIVLLLVIGGFFLSWRMHTFRVTDEAVEVRSGILFRTHRKAKLDRIQGVGINRPLLPRIFGAAKMEVSVAGQDASVKLEYLYSRDADDLRRDVLTLASGVKLAEAGVAPRPTVGPAGVESPTDPALTRLVTERVNEFLAPELDPNAAPPESVVRISIGRLIGSTLLSSGTVFLIILAVVMIFSLVNGQFWSLFWFVPSVIGFVSYYSSSVMKSLRYSIAKTSSGVRIGFGLLSTSNDTLPPGRIHAVEISQSVIWRPFDWWQVKINKAGLSAEAAMNGKGNTTILPVGNLSDVAKVLELILDGVSAEALHVELSSAFREPQRSGFILAPRRARWINPFAWRRTGYAVHDGLLLFRRGVIWRKLDLLPLARMQSIAVSQGPLERTFRLASARAHTVVGPISASLPAIGSDEALRLFERVSLAAVEASAIDRSHRWAEKGVDA